MKAYKKTEKPVTPPPTVFLELTEDEYSILREGAYHVYAMLENSLPRDRKVATNQVKGAESMKNIARRLYNTLPYVETMQEG